MPVPQQLAAFRQAREETLALAAPLPQDQLDVAPGPGKWSVGEVLDHLTRTDGLYRREIALLVDLARSGRRPQLKRKFADLDAAPAGIPKPWLRFLNIPFTLMSKLMPRSVGESMAANRKVHFRHPEAATPQPGRPAAALLQDLRASYQALESLFTDNPDLDYAAMHHQHPLFGVNNVPQILSFMTGHERRHQAQIRDILEATP